MKMIQLLLLVLVASVLECRRKTHKKRKHKSGSGDETMFESEVILKRHNAGMMCRLKMVLKHSPVEMTGQNAINPMDQIHVDGKRCFCKFMEEIPQQNECEQLLNDEQVSFNMIAVKEELIKDTKVEDKRCVHNCFKDKKKRRFMKKRKNVNSQATPNVSIPGEYGYQVDDNHGRQVMNGMPIWWLSMNRYVLDCNTDQEARDQCLRHCLTVKTQTFDLNEKAVSSTTDISANDAIKPAHNC